VPTITITVPEGTTININGVAISSDSTESAASEGPLARYWKHYLSNNTRKLLNAAAMWEDFKKSGFTLQDLAGSLNIDYESVRSFKQTLGRPAKKWQADTGTPEPIRLDWSDYHATGDGMRTVYYLPEGMAKAILELSAQFMVQPAGSWSVEN
jgi:hypothetical protein